MSTYVYLTIVGLSFNLVGSIIIVFYGFPQPDHGGSSVTAIELEDNNIVEGEITAGEYRKRTAKKKGLYRKISIVGASMMSLGFILQLSGIIQAL